MFNFFSFYKAEFPSYSFPYGLWATWDLNNLLTEFCSFSDSINSKKYWFLQFRLLLEIYRKKMASNEK